MALTQGRQCTFKCQWGVKANRCPVLSHTPTVLWLYSCFCPYCKWDKPMRRPQRRLKPLKMCLKRYIPRCQKRCQRKDICTYTLCTPRMSNTFPQLRLFCVLSFYFDVNLLISIALKETVLCGPFLIKTWKKIYCAKNKVAKVSSNLVLMYCFIVYLTYGLSVRDSYCSSVPCMLPVMPEQLQNHNWRWNDLRTCFSCQSPIKTV